MDGAEGRRALLRRRLRDRADHAGRRRRPLRLDDERRVPQRGRARADHAGPGDADRRGRRLRRRRARRRALRVGDRVRPVVRAGPARRPALPRAARATSTRARSSTAPGRRRSARSSARSSRSRAASTSPGSGRSPPSRRCCCSSCACGVAPVILAAGGRRASWPRSPARRCPEPAAARRDTAAAWIACSSPPTSPRAPHLAPCRPARRRSPRACARRRSTTSSARSHLLGEGTVAARRDRARPPALDGPLRAARLRQDDARADRRRRRRRRLRGAERGRGRARRGARA